MDRLKTITNIPGWDRWFADSEKVTDVATAYKLVPLLYRAVELRTDAISTVPGSMYPVPGKDPVNWPFSVSLSDMLALTERSLLMTGAAFWEIGANTLGSRFDLRWINPTIVKVKFNDGTYSFDIGGDKEKYTKVNAPKEFPQMIYIREFDLSQDVFPGVCAAEVALQDAQLLHYTTAFASKFFEQGAQPLTVLGFEEISNEEAKRVGNAFQRAANGIKNAFGTVAMRTKGMEIHQITPPLKDLVMPELNAESRKALALAFKIPQTMMEDAANFATASEHRISYWRDTVRPRGEWLESQFNGYLKLMRLRLELEFDEMDVFQANEAERAASLNQLRQAGYPLMIASDILGYDLDDDQRAKIEAIDNMESSMTTETPQTVELAKWQRKAVKAIERGKSALVDFDSDLLPESMVSEIKAGLIACKRKEDVKLVFKKHSTDRGGELIRSMIEIRKAM